ncbi:MAG: FmdB family transcriptional regulator [Acidimicrobiales bacterium MED-G01]|nr:MAG: FmdB family transcriptional regulator [Acidimicrobiales bacterium MED-G01]|tara:strand:+ start:222 stop:566 length:345 start_codon:yes stop_codon:yes gene_type:complete
MPTYQYRCTACDDQFELRQSFSDDPITSCPTEGCGGEVKKVFGSVGIAFKGSGFYKNDSRSGGNKSSESSGSTEGNKESSTSSESKSSSSSSAEKSSSTADKSSSSNASKTAKD